MGKRDGPPPNPAGVVTGGRRWLAIDADMFSKRFIHDLHAQFGFAGIAVWVAFLCACKQSKTPGWVRMSNDVDGMSKLGLSSYDLVDNKGELWTLTEFFDFTGRKKQTRRVAVQRPDSRRIAAARLLDVGATHWEHWQDAARTDAERERKRRWWAENRGESASSGPLGASSGPLGARQELAPDIDIDSDIPPTPARRFASNGKPQPPDPPRPPVPEWQPDPEPTSTIDRAALDALRTQHGWKKPDTTDG